MNQIFSAFAFMFALTAQTAGAQAPAYVYPPAVPLHNYPGYPDLQGYSAEPDVEPATWVHQNYDGGLTIFAGTNRNSRVPIGGLVRLTYEFRHPKDLLVDLTGLAQGFFGENSVLKLRWPDEPARCIRITTRIQGDEKIERVEIDMQHFTLATVKNEISFAMRFRYSHEKQDGVENFVTVTSPILKITVVRSGDRSFNWRYGELPTMPVQRSMPALFFIAIGVCLVSYELLYGALLLKQKYLPGRARTDVQVAVATYRRVARQSQSDGKLSRAQVTELATAFRTAFGAQTVTGAAIDKHFAGHRKQKSICAALRLLDAASIDGTRTIGGDERKQLLKDIADALGDR